MKKMYIGILILAILLASSLYNVHYLEKKIGVLLNDVSATQELADAGDFEGAAEMLQQTLNSWNSMDSYTHIFIRHSETDSTSDAFFEYMSDLCAQDPGSAQGSCEALKHHLMSIVTMEQVSIGSIF